MTPGRQRAEHFRGYDRELVSKPAISLKKKWGGYRSKIPQEKPVYVYRSTAPTGWRGVRDSLSDGLSIELRLTRGGQRVGRLQQGHAHPPVLFAVFSLLA